MHPTVMSDVAKDRIGDLHRQAGRASTARAARTTHADRRPAHLAAVPARPVRAALSSPSPRPRRSAEPGQPCEATP
jgi:hypothetical protein